MKIFKNKRLVFNELAGELTHFVRHTRACDFTFGELTALSAPNPGNMEIKWVWWVYPNPKVL